jgi:hypothetical protein
MKRIFKNTKKCKCCERISEYYIDKRVHYDSDGSGRDYNWCIISEDAGDCWVYLKEEYINIEHHGYYCSEHLKVALNTSIFN